MTSISQHHAAENIRRSYGLISVVKSVPVSFEIKIEDLGAIVSPDRLVG
jgi:hypothetical protein